jgi:hypothetical protein
MEKLTVLAGVKAAKMYRSNKYPKKLEISFGRSRGKLGAGPS